MPTSATAQWLPRPPRRRRPGPLAVICAVIVGCVASPLVFVVVQATQAGWTPVQALLRRPLIGQLIWHTAALAAAVSVAAAAIGFGSAYLIERTNLPFRRVFGVLLVLPLAVPEFVQGFAWVSLTSSVRGYWGATLVMTCSLYPLVYLPVAAALRRADPSVEEVALSLGRSRLSVLWRVTLPLVRPALGGGTLLVCLYLLGEYGAFAALRFQTFATAVFTEFRVAYDTAAASMLTLFLCAFALLVVVGEARLTGRGRTTRAHSVRRVPPLLELGRWRWVAAAAVTVLLGLALGVPLAALGYWFVQGTSSTLPPASILGETRATLVYALSAAIVATAAAVPLALYSWRRRGRLAMAMERGVYLTRAVPGVAVGLSVIYVGIHYLGLFYGRPPMLAAGYVVLFFPLALTGVRAALATVPPNVEEVARSLGLGPLRVLIRVTLPLVLPGIGVAIALVTVSASTELTATLLLRPIGTDTLATRFWTYTGALAYGQAAPYAAVMIGISIVPVLLLARRGSLG